MSRVAPLILLSAAILLSSTATAYNITRLLGNYPQFSEFNQLLTRTKIADEINRRATITVLVIPNDAIGGLTSRPEDVQKRILSNHVVLDYYDQLKLSKLKDNKTTLTTLYQASGTADERQGFLKVEGKNGGINFGSDVKGAPADSKYVASVAAQPYNISVISISQPIVAPGIDGSLPNNAPKSAPAPKATSPASAPPPATTTTQAPTTTTEAPAVTTSQAPTPDASSPPPADTPSADATSAPPPRSDAGKISGVSLGFVVAIAAFIAAQ